MPRTTLILIIVLVVALIGGGVWYWLNRDTIGQPPATTNTTNTVVTNTNTTTTANINGSLPNEVKGDKAFSGKATVAGVELNFSSATKLKTVEGAPAPDKKLFVIVYFDPVPGDKVLVVKDGLTDNHRLVTNKGNGQPDGVKIASDVVTGDRGYLKYIVAEDATAFTLEIGPSGNAVRLPVTL